MPKGKGYGNKEKKGNQVEGTGKKAKKAKKKGRKRK